MMRNILLLFSMLLFMTVNAQQPNGQTTPKKDKSGLTAEEFKTAKAGYIEVTKSETYKKFRLNDIDITVRLKNVKLPPAIKRSRDKEAIRKWAEANIKNTAFASVEECVEMIYGSYDLFVNLYNENKELYTLIFKATKGQFTEIMKAGDKATIGRAFGKTE